MNSTSDRFRSGVCGALPVSAAGLAAAAGFAAAGAAGCAAAAGAAGFAAGAVRRVELPPVSPRRGATARGTAPVHRRRNAVRADRELRADRFAPRAVGVPIVSVFAGAGVSAAFGIDGDAGAASRLRHFSRPGLPMALAAAETGAAVAVEPVADFARATGVLSSPLVEAITAAPAVATFAGLGAGAPASVLGRRRLERIAHFLRGGAKLGADMRDLFEDGLGRQPFFHHARHQMLEEEPVNSAHHDDRRRAP